MSAELPNNQVPEDTLVKWRQARSYDLSNGPRLDDYNGMAFLKGTFYAYTASANMEGRNVFELIGQLSTGSELQQVCRIFQIDEIIQTSSALLEFSRARIALQSDPLTFRPVDDKATSDFFSNFNFTLLTRELYDSRDQEGSFHRLAMYNLYRLRDFSDIAGVVARNYENDLSPHKLIRIRDASHNATGVYTSFNMGVYMFENYSRKLDAHTKFMNAFGATIQYCSTISRIINDENSENLPDGLNDLINCLTNIYQEDQVTVQHCENNLLLAAEKKDPIANVIHNIMTNALKFSAHPSAQEKLLRDNSKWQFHPIKLEVTVKDDNLIISIADSGIPISEEERRLLLSEGSNLNNINAGIPSTGHGMGSIHASLREIDGTMDIVNNLDNDSPYAKAFVVSIPLKKVVRV